MFLSDLSIKRPVLISMIMIGLLLFGVLGFLSLPLNLMPDIKIPYITIQTVYAGAAPEQIEDLITKKIEDEVSSIGLLDTIQSYSLNSVSIITLEFDLDKDIDIAAQDVKEKIDAIANSLPDGAESPVVSKVDISATAVMEVMLSGEIDPTELYYLADTTVKDRLSQIEGVGNVEVLGGIEKEIRVEFDNRTIYENQMNLTQVAGLLAYANMDMPGGYYQEGQEDYSVNLKGKISTTEELSNVTVPTASGMRKLRELAEIEASSADIRKRVTYFDTEENLRQDNTVLLSIIKSPDGNPVEVVEAVKSILPQLRENLPENVNLKITLDDSTYIQDTANDTLSNILLGIIFTAAILLFFLHDIRSTLIVALSMPLSIIPTFIILNQLGITLNLMSLMGLSTSVGVLVMNSVVVLENIFRHKSMGHGRKEAAAKGTGEVAIAVIASTLTNICVFLPLGTMDGIVGVMIGDFALTVVIATLFSLIISFTLTPMLASLLLPETQKKKMKISQKIEDFFKSLEKGYAFLLEKTLHNRLRSGLLIASTFLLFILAMAGFRFVPFEFQSEMDSGLIKIEVELPEDASLEQTAEIVKQVEDKVADFEEVKQIVTNLGSISSLDSGTNLAKLSIQLIGKDLRENSSIVANRIGNALTDIPGAVLRVNSVSSTLSSGSAPVSFFLQGNDAEELSEYTALMREEMEKIPGLTAVNISQKSGKPEITLYPDRQKLAETGVSVQDLALSMRSAIDGIVTTQMKTENREYDIRVTISDEDVAGYEKVRNIPVSSGMGIYPLSYFTEIRIESGVSKLMRVNKKDSVEFSANLLPGTVLGTATTAVEDVAADLLPKTISLRWGGDAEMMKETIGNMAFAFLIAVILTYMLLAGILEKIGQPLLILSTVPLSLIGVVALFLITGFTMNMASMMAIIMLVGMVVNNAILILEYTNQLRAGGMDVRTALLTACPTKLQPILMANIATILGMLPMAMGIGSAGAEMRQPMGVVSIGGLIAATFLTLFVIPAVENLLESGKEEKKAKKQMIEVNKEVVPV